MKHVVNDPDNTCKQTHKNEEKRAGVCLHLCCFLWRKKKHFCLFVLSEVRRSAFLPRWPLPRLVSGREKPSRPTSRPPLLNKFLVAPLGCGLGAAGRGTLRYFGSPTLAGFRGHSQQTLQNQTGRKWPLAVFFCSLFFFRCLLGCRVLNWEQSLRAGCILMLSDWLAAGWQAELLVGWSCWQFNRTANRLFSLTLSLSVEVLGWLTCCNLQREGKIKSNTWSLELNKASNQADFPSLRLKTFQDWQICSSNLVLFNHFPPKRWKFKNLALLTTFRAVN